MATAVVSDFHLGTRPGGDMAASGEPRGRLLEALSGADRVILLGDVVELRERGLAPALERGRPFFEALGSTLAGVELVVVPGNHDHVLADPWLASGQLDSRSGSAEQVWPVGRGDGAAGRLASWLPGIELKLAYPGLWLRDDIYATHGHFLDVHLTVPRLESIAASAMARVSGRSDPRASADYEALLAPLYAFHFAFAQSASVETLTRGAGISRAVWRRANSDSDGRLARFLLRKVTVPGAIAALNLLGVGPLKPDLSGEELYRAGLRAMARVADGMQVEAEHVIFGHTHRPGPLPGDEEAEWVTPAGRRLHNSGSWLWEDVFLGPDPRESPYWPGTIVWVDDAGPPRLERLL